MDTYNVQSYFKSLCKSYYIAYEQTQRRWFKNDIESEDYKFWLRRVNACQNEIETVIEEISINEILIIISTKEEVFTLISFLSTCVDSEGEYLKYHFINIDIDANATYPMEDELCKDFWEQYIGCQYNENMFTLLLSRWEERWK